MAERKSSAPAEGTAGARAPGFELRLEQGKAFVCLGDRVLAPGARALELAMEVPEVRFPFDVGLGAAQFRRRLCDLCRLEIALGDEFLADLASRLDLAGAGLASLSLAVRGGFAEGAGQLEGGVPFTFKAGIEPSGDQGLSVVIYETRLYGLASIPSVAIPALLARAAAGLARPEEAALLVDPLAGILRRLIPPRGWKLPRTAEARLALARATPGELRLAWDRSLTGPIQIPADPDRLAAIEGARAFRAAEALVARGEWDAAREAYLASGPAATGHPFAAARLLSLLVLDERFHDEALDHAAHWIERRPDFAPALVTEGVLRARRGEIDRAARAFAALAAAAVKKGEELGALQAADACFALGAGGDPAAVGRAVETALSLRRGHLPALRALLAVAERTGDREALLRACRRLAAYAPEDAEKARAHAQLAELLLKADPPAARLHLDQALRLAPDDTAALSALARACEEAGEHLRAVRAHDRLREIHLARGDSQAAARAAVAVGILWEEKLGHPENALLRYREACELSSATTEARLRAAQVADALGQWAEAADHYAGLLAALDPGEPGAPGLAARAHRALARIAESRLADPARAASHLEAALTVDPHDPESLQLLAEMYRELSRPAELLGTLDRLAPLVPGPAARAAILAEAGHACLGPLALPDAARSRFAAALALDPQCRMALEGVARLAADRKDAQAEREALARLVLLARGGTEEASLYDRLASACERAGDLAAASRAAAAARRAEPSFARLAEAVRIARGAGDGPALAGYLTELATAARAAGDVAGAAAAWRERAALLGPSDPAQALAALTEARALAPGDPEVLRTQASLAEVSGDHLLALSALRALLAAGASDSAALELRAARAARAAGDPGSAREHAERALADGESGAAAVLAEVLDASGDRGGRAAMLERAGRHLEAAALWREIGAADRARAAVERAAADPATAAEALPLLAETRLATGDRAGAAAALLDLARRRGGADGARRALRAGELDPSLAGEALALAAPWFLAEGNRTEAVAQLREALRREAASLPALTLLLSAEFSGLLEAGERADLLGRLAAARGVAPERAGAALAERARLVASGTAGGGREAALADARRAADLTPEDASNLDLLAELARQAGDAGAGADALLDRARLAVEAADPEAASRLAAAGQAALAAGRTVDGEGALREALALGLDPDEARSTWRALADRARASGDDAGERSALASLIPLLPTGERPARLLRLSTLQSRAGDLEAARRAAEEARTLAPRDLGAVEACRAVAEQQGDGAAVAERLAELALLEPEQAGQRLLTRARLLAGALAMLEQADDAFTEALARLPADAALAAEHSRFRRNAPAPVRERPWGEPLERFALKAPDERTAAGAWRDAAYLALAQGDGASALRCARRAFARTREEPAFAASLLARVLYREGSGAEALVLHRNLFESGFSGIEEGDVAVLCRQLAELAEDAGETDLALEALDSLLSLRPQDLEAAEWRFRLDPDRPRAVRQLTELVGATRSVRRRSRALALAAQAAHGELGDPALADALWHRARAAAGDHPSLLAQLETVRLEAARRDYAPDAPRPPSELLEALHDAAAAWEAAGDADAARALREEAVALERRHGSIDLARADLEALERDAGERGDEVAARGYTRQLGLLMLESDAALAEQALRRATAGGEADAEAWAALEGLARRQGTEGAPLLAEALRARATQTPDGSVRAEVLVELARLLAGPIGDAGRAAATLREALDASPDHVEARAELEALARSQGLEGELGRLLLDRAARSPDAAERVALRSEAARHLAAEADPASRTLAAQALDAALADAPGDPALIREVSRLFVALGRRAEAVPYLAALVRADPDDEESAQALAEAYAGRHRDRAELFLTRAASATGQARALRLREAAKALFAAGDEGQARDLLRQAFDAWPADDSAFLAAIRDAAADVDRLDGVLRARAEAVPAEAAGCHRARADALLAFGRVEAALAALEGCLAASPDDASALAMIAEIRAEREGDAAASEADARLCALSDATPGLVPASSEARARYRVGLASWARGRPDEGIANLERALALAPADDRAGLAWAALSSGYAARGEPARALEAARRRAERADQLGLAAERREALEAGAALAAQFGDRGMDAAAILESLAALRLSEAGGPDPALDALVERAIGALLSAGESARAEALMALAARGAEGPRRVDLISRLADTARARGDEGAFRAARSTLPWGTVPEEEAGAPPPLELTFLEPLADAAEHTRRAEGAESPGRRAAEHLSAAAALERAGSPPADVRAAIEQACNADPDEAAPWKALAAFEARHGEPLAAARAHLALAIRAEGDEAASAALDAARIFEQIGRPGDAARAYSAAVQSRPGCHPARRALALLAMEKGDAAAAANHLAAVDPDEVPFADRVDFARLKARALSAAGRHAEAAGAWEQVFRADPADEEAFETLAPRARQAGRLEEWLALAARHDAALATTGNATRRRDLRCERAGVLSEMGRLEAAEGAWRAALEIDPDHQPAREALASLSQRAHDWGKVAEDLAAEAARAQDPAEGAALLLRRGRLLLEKLSDPAAAALALEEAAARARAAPSLQAAIRASREAERLLVSVLPALGRRAEAAVLAARLRRAGVADPEVLALAGEAPPEAAPEAQAPAEPAAPRSALEGDAVADILRGQAEAAQGEERITLFERLAGHLERSGDRPAAADALLEALSIDPARDLTFAWFLALAEEDRGRLAAGHRLRALAATDAAARSQSLGDLGKVLAGAPETAAEGVQQLERAMALDPSNLAAAETLARAHLDLGHPELALPLLEKLEGGGPTLSGEAVASLLAEARRSEGTPPQGLPRERELARGAPSDPGKQEVWAAAAEAAGELGEAADAWEAALQAEPEAGPEDLLRRLRGRARAAQALGRAAEALDLEERALALLPQGPERAPELADLAERAEALGDPERALRLAELARAADPRHGPTLAVVCRLRDAAGDVQGLVEAARELEAAMGPEAVAPFSARLGQLHAEKGEWEQAYARLKVARLADPQDTAVAQDLARAAEKLGHLEEAVSLAEQAADALATYDPAAAAARYRQCGETWRDRLSDPERAAVMLEKALSLVPQDRDTSRQLLELWAARHETAPRALDGWLELARQNPADAGALSALAQVCRQLSRTESDPTLLARAASAEALARFASPGQAPGQPAPQARRLPPEIRQRAAVPGASGPTAQLLTLLAPHLERLFPADLARRGVGPVDRLGPGRVPSLHARVESASRVLGARPVALFLAQQGGAEISLENTQPVAMVVGARALDSLSPGALSFLVARTLELLQSGWALVGKFAPRDVAILCELACRFAGGQPPTLGLPEQRAGAFLSALAGAVPPAVRDRAAALGKACAEELRTLDARALVAAIRRSANRSALLVGGDPQAALEALARQEKGVAGADGVIDPAKALAVPDLRDVAIFALSDLYLELRGAVVG